MSMVQLKVHFEISKTEVHYHLEMGAAGYFPKDGIFLTSVEKTPACGQWQLHYHKDRKWVELQIFSLVGLKDETTALQSFRESWNLLSKDMGEHQMIRVHLPRYLKEKMNTAAKGPAQLGLGLPESFLVAYRYPVINDTNPQTAIAKIYQQAQTSLKHDSRDERLFVSAHVGLSLAVLPELINRLKRLFQKLSAFEPSHDPNTKEYLCGMSAIPFTSHSSQSDPAQKEHTIHGQNSWLIWVIREMVKFEDFRLDSDWIASRLAISVSKVQINQALTWMLEKKIIYIDPESQQPKQTTNNLLTAPELTGEAITKHYQELMELTPSMYQHTSHEQRYMQFIRLRLTQENFQRLRSFISQFSRSILEIEKKVLIPEEVFLLGFSFFPYKADADSGFAPEISS